MGDKRYHDYIAQGRCPRCGGPAGETLAHCDNCRANMRTAYANRRAPLRRIQEVRRRFGLSPEQHAALKDSQGGRCKVCGGDNGGKTLHIDHCHTTGKVRGLLCQHCNIGIGQMRDNPTLLRLAAEYLEAA